MRQHGLGLRAAIVFERAPHIGAAVAQDRGSQQGGIRGAGGADGERADRDAGGHLDDGQKRIDAVQRARLHGHAKDGQGGLGGDHAGQVGSTARTGEPHVRTFRDERERTLLLLVDLRPSMLWGTRRALRSAAAVEAAALAGWRALETGGRIGFITPLTHNFCESCNRVRLTCTGTLYMCLGQEDAADLREPLRASPTDEKPHEAIEAAIRRKPKGHDFIIDRRHSGPAVGRHMSVTGG